MLYKLNRAVIPSAPEIVQNGGEARDKTGIKIPHQIQICPK